jgi:hypothetical protein
MYPKTQKKKGEEIKNPRNPLQCVKRVNADPYILWMKYNSTQLERKRINQETLVVL